MKSQSGQYITVRVLYTEQARVQHRGQPFSYSFMCGTLYHLTLFRLIIPVLLLFNNSALVQETPKYRLKYFFSFFRELSSILNGINYCTMHNKCPISANVCVEMAVA